MGHDEGLDGVAEVLLGVVLGDTVEALVVAHRAGLTIRQVPVAMRVRSCGRASTDPVRSAVYLLRVVVAVGLAMVRRAPR